MRLSSNFWISALRPGAWKRTKASPSLTAPSANFRSSYRCGADGLETVAALQHAVDRNGFAHDQSRHDAESSPDHGRDRPAAQAAARRSRPRCELRRFFQTRVAYEPQKTMNPIKPLRNMYFSSGTSDIIGFLAITRTCEGGSHGEHDGVFAKHGADLLSYPRTKSMPDEFKHFPIVKVAI